MPPLHTSGPSKIGVRQKGPPKPGVAANSRFERLIPPGKLLFAEGDTGTEMFIIKKGKVKILKEEGSTVIELVTLGPGSVLGEMSLLDNAPRSASAKAVEPLAVTVIDQNHLDNTLSKVPEWLKNVIKIVVSRLRDTTNRNYQDMLRSGFVAVLKSLNIMTLEGVIVNGGNYYYPVDKIKELSYSIFGLSSADAAKIIEYLGLLSLGALQKNKVGKQFLKVAEPEIFEVYYDFLHLVWKGKEPLSKQASENAKKVASDILEAGKTRASKRHEFLILDHKQLVVHREQQADYDEIEPGVLEELEKLGIIQLESKSTSTKQSTYNRSNIMYKAEHLNRFIMECDWEEYFSRDIMEGMN